MYKIDSVCMAISCMHTGMTGRVLYDHQLQMFSPLKQNKVEKNRTSDVLTQYMEREKGQISEILNLQLTSHMLSLGNRKLKSQTYHRVPSFRHKHL